MVKYYKKIDGLRCVAIMLVLIQHFADLIGRNISAGYYGVDLFFVISGFLITSILFNSKKYTFGQAYKNFIGRRTLRIFPLYYGTILILWIANVHVVRNYIFYLLTYTWNYGMLKHNVPITNAVGHFWSLCIEEQFYLFWPFIVLSLNKRYKLLLAVIVSIIIVSFFQLGFGFIRGNVALDLFGMLVGKMSSLAFGALAAVLFHNNKIPDKLFNNKYVEITMLLILPVSLIIHYSLVKVFLLVCCSFYLVIKTAHSDFNLKGINRFLENKNITYIGTISYGIYVFHYPLVHFLTPYLFDPIWHKINFARLGRLSILQWNSWLVKFPLYTAISILVASVSYKYFERPILTLKDRYFRA